jgi:hypothetical protein
VLPAVLKDDAKNQASQVALRGRVARREVARILGREFLVIEECADELSGRGEDLRGFGRVCLLYDPTTLSYRGLNKKAGTS